MTDRLGPPPPPPDPRTAARLASLRPETAPTGEELPPHVADFLASETAQREPGHAAIAPLETISFADLLVADLGVLRWRVDGLIPAVGCGFIASAPKAFKSWLALDAMVAVTSGQPFLNRATLQGEWSVLYISGESGRITTRNRLEWLCRGRGIRPEDIGQRLQLSFFPSIDLREDLAELAVRAALADMSPAPALVIYDPLTRLHTGKENERDDIEPILTGLRQLSEDLKTCVLVVHHSPKNVDHPLRGTSSFAGWFDFLIWPKRKKGTAEATIDVMLRDGEPVDGIAIRLEINGSTDDTRTARILVDTAARLETAAEKNAREILAYISECSAPVTGTELRKAHPKVGGTPFKAAVALAEARGEIRNIGTVKKPAWVPADRAGGDLFDDE